MVIDNVLNSKALDYVWIVNVVDRSGSMEHLASDMTGSIEKFLRDQADLPGRCKVGLAQFDDIYEVVYSDKDIKNRPSYKLVARGSTALLDAIGKTITTTRENFTKLSVSNRPQKVYIVITTDGYENASKEWTKDKIASLISEVQRDFDWEVVYLGANQDAIQTGAAFGTSMRSTMTYNATPMGVTTAYIATSDSISSSRLAGGQALNYTDDQRSDAVENENKTSSSTSSK